MDFHFATLWEAVSDIVGDRPAIYCGEVERTWSDYDERAARLASVYRAGGAGKDTKVGIYLRNCTEYLEARYAAFKLPKQVVFVDRVQRAPNGKADYKWARGAALAGIGG